MENTVGKLKPKNKRLLQQKPTCESANCMGQLITKVHPFLDTGTSECLAVVLILMQFQK